MHSIYPALRVIVIAEILIAGGHSHAQNAGASPKGEVVLVKLAPPAYPPLAWQAHITGDVFVTVDVGQDGGIRSATVIQGHPLLAQAALDSSHHSQFECRNCGEEGLSYQLTFTFKLDSNDCFEPYGKPPGSREPIPQVTQTANSVTIATKSRCVDHAPLGPGYQSSNRSRAAKCLYLWHCGPPRINGIP